MAERKSFLLRMDRELLDAVHRWANHDLRSLNGHIEFLLRRALQQAGRQPPSRASHEHTTPDVSTNPTVERLLDEAPGDSTT